MDIILGFGCIEEQERMTIKKAICDGITKGEKVDEILDQWNKKADMFDKQARDIAPERYTRIRFYDDTLCFLHINRNHPLSPDGWAMLKIEESFELKDSQ